MAMRNYTDEEWAAYAPKPPEEDDDEEEPGMFDCDAFLYPRGSNMDLYLKREYRGLLQCFKTRSDVSEALDTVTLLEKQYAAHAAAFAERIAKNKKVYKWTKPVCGGPPSRRK